jgi:nicotinamide-nucleotide adenylyltransferase
MARHVLLEEGIPPADFSIVPFPINFPELYRYYLPMDAVFYLTIYDSWGRRKLERFQNLGLKTEILWERPLEKKGLSATDIRRSMVRGEPWEHLVPPAAAALMLRWGIPERLKALHGE